MGRDDVARAELARRAREAEEAAKAAEERATDAQRAADQAYRDAWSAGAGDDAADQWEARLDGTDEFMRAMTGATPDGKTAEDVYREGYDAAIPKIGDADRAKAAADQARAEAQKARAEADRLRELADAPQESILDDIDTGGAALGVMGLAPEEGSVLTQGMLDALKKPQTMVRLAAAGLGLIGLVLLVLGLRAEAGQTPSGTPASATPTSAASASTAGSPVTQRPVTGETTANASFVKVSGPCNLAARFSDRFSLAAVSGALTLTQLSNNHVSRGTISPNGEFATSAEGQAYRGTVTGTTARGQHTYTAQGCNEVYDFTMQLSGPLVATSGSGAGPNRPPEAGGIVAQQVGTATIYTVQTVRDPDGDRLRYAWTNTTPCGTQTGAATSVFTWSHPHPPCPDEPLHPGAIVVTIDDGRFSIQRQYLRGSQPGTGGVPLAGVGISTIAPSATPTSSPASAAPTSAAPSSAAPTAAPATSGGGPNVPLAGLGLVLIVGALGTILLGPRLAGGPLVQQQKDGEDDPCARERAREAAARAARDAADERNRRIQDLQGDADRTRRDAEAKERAAGDAARGASSYQGADGRTVYTNPQQRARIEAAQAEATAARGAATAAQQAYDAAGGAGELQAAGDEVFRAHREWRDAKASLDACLHTQSLAAPPPPPPTGGSGGGATTGGTGVGVGTGTDDGTRTRTRRPCVQGEVKEGSEVITEHRFSMHDVGNAQISVEGTRLNTDDSHARGFLDHLENVDRAFKAGKIGAGLAEGELVGPALDAIDFPDFLTYFGDARELLDKTMRDFLEKMRQHRRQGAYTIAYTTHHFLLTCRKWEECDGERFVPKSETTLTLVRSAAASRGPELLTDEESRRVWLDNWLRALRGHNDQAQRDADTFRQGCR